MKTVERDTARKLRREGLSMRQIERRPGVARSTVSLWVREIELTDHQREELRRHGVSARTRGRQIYFALPNDALRVACKITKTNSGRSRTSGSPQSICRDRA